MIYSSVSALRSRIYKSCCYSVPHDSIRMSGDTSSILTSIDLQNLHIIDFDLHVDRLCSLLKMNNCHIHKSIKLPKSMAHLRITGTRFENPILDMSDITFDHDRDNTTNLIYTTNLRDIKLPKCVSVQKQDFKIEDNKQLSSLCFDKIYGSLSIIGSTELQKFSDIKFEYVEELLFHRFVSYIKNFNDCENIGTIGKLMLNSSPSISYEGLSNLKITKYLTIDAITRFEHIAEVCLLDTPIIDLYGMYNSHISIMEKINKMISDSRTRKDYMMDITLLLFDEHLIKEN